MLSNKTYMGALDQLRKTTRNYKDRREIILAEEDHIIVYDTHEPIINKAIFERVQAIFGERCVRTSEKSNTLYLFSGMLRCADCGSAMIRNSTFMKGKWYVYHKCRAYNQRGTEACSRSHSIPDDILTDIVRYTINAHVQTLVNIKKAIHMINQSKKIKQLTFDYGKLISDKVRQKEELKNMKTNAHMRYLGLVTGSDDIGIAMSIEDIAAIINNLDERIEKLNNEITTLEYEKQAEEDIRNNELTWLDKLVEYGYLKSLSRDITTEFINCIYVSVDKKIKIEFKYQNQYDRLTQYIERYSQEIDLEGAI